ncbi:MAG: tetratricopeptide repeat protein [Acidobacteria bacterium]|nr:tetratricopeptide repeat protein [Acidobacteriota bacterium]
MARLTRHQMKQDELSARLASGMNFFQAHKKNVSLAVAVSVAALAVGLGLYFYIRGQQRNAAAAFAKALNTYHAPVLTNPPAIPNLEVYKTNDEKNQKALEAFQTVARDYSRYAAGRLARYYAAICLRELGKYPDAEKEFQALAEFRDANLASLAKVGLASVYEGTNRSSEAEKIYKDLEEHPTVAVPKATAAIKLADLYSKTNTAEASTLYQQIQKDYPGTPAADYAGQMLTQLPQ